MKKIKNILLVIFLIILLISTLTGCNNKKDNNEESKIISELDYLDTNIVSILNGLNGITTGNYTITKEEIQKQEKSSESSSQGGNESSENNSSGEQEQTQSQSNDSSSSEESKITVTGMNQKTVISSDENNIDWNLIKNEIEKINDSWSIIILDLASKNVNNEDILNFSSTLNNTILSIKDENKINALENSAKLYSFIPKFHGQLEQNTSNQKLKKVKSDLFNAYSLVEKEDWAQIENNIISSINTFKEILNDIEYVKNKEYKTNKVYVLLNELQSSLVYRDKKLFYLKYKNLVESINLL